MACQAKIPCKQQQLHAEQAEARVPALFILKGKEEKGNENAIRRDGKPLSVAKKGQDIAWASPSALDSGFGREKTGCAVADDPYL